MGSTCQVGGERGQTRTDEDRARTVTDIITVDGSLCTDTIGVCDDSSLLHYCFPCRVIGVKRRSRRRQVLISTLLWRGRDGHHCPAGRGRILQLSRLQPRESNCILDEEL